MKKIPFLIILSVFIFLSSCEKTEDEIKPPDYVPIDLQKFSENFKGFNLLGKFDVSWSNTGFTEEEFQIIEELGFNFVRLPLDYRTYTKSGDWSAFQEQEIKEIDDAIEWGKKYGVHVCINLHRAPGYCVNPATLPANQDLDLWRDMEAQDMFVKHWEFFAQRYRDESVEDVSFNLINEPGGVDESTYAGVMQKAIDKIHQVNPNRVIFVDGLDYGRNLIRLFKGSQNIIQALHVYDPFTLTHYKASWVTGSNSWPEPVWPMTGISQYLFGPWKTEYFSSLMLVGDFQKDTEVIINVHQVSIESTLQIMLDDVEILRKYFLCGPGLGDDWSEIVLTEWGYQNISNQDYSVTLPENGSVLSITNIDGDWMTMNTITIRSGAEEIVIIPANTSWGSKQSTYNLTQEGTITDVNGDPVLALGSLLETLEEAQSENIPIMIQEFGVHNQTPHKVTLAYLTDVVSIFNTNQIGYAIWNLSGSFGILNSSRSDCTYESFRGYQLDRAMTTILQSTGD